MLASGHNVDIFKVMLYCAVDFVVLRAVGYLQPRSHVQVAHEAAHACPYHTAYAISYT